jgi:NADPH-dependent 2,4-dienoyl-CoA reductase/sulfur reductase-like enzyme
VTRLVVVGGDAAGMTAAATARRRDAALDIVAFERGDHTSYSACGLPYYVAGLVPDHADLIARSPAEHRALGVGVHTRHEVVAVDTERRTVRVRDLDAASERDESYDVLVLATGASPVRPPLPGVDAEGVFGIQTIGDGIALHEWLEQHHPRHAVVVGGGYIGLEMAEAMTHLEIDVTVIDRHDQPMSTLDPDMGALVGDALRGLGINVKLGVAVTAFATDADGRVRAVVTADGEIRADVVVLGLGVHPNVELARDAGIALGDHGGIRVDPAMRTSASDVYAAGDCVESWHRLRRQYAVVALGTHANKQGRVAGINITGGQATFPGVIGTAVTKVCAYEVARTGLGEREAADAGYDAVAARIDSTTRAGYYPGSERITVKMVAERGSGRLLGAQIIGQEGAAKRIDVAATAIWNEMTAAECAMLDLAYAPPYSPVWDPVLVGARKVADLV